MDVSQEPISKRPISRRTDGAGETYICAWQEVLPFTETQETVVEHDGRSLPDTSLPKKGTPEHENEVRRTSMNVQCSVSFRKFQDSCQASTVSG